MTVFRDVRYSQLAIDRVCVFEVVPARFLSKAWAISHECCSNIQALAEVLMQKGVIYFKSSVNSPLKPKGINATLLKDHGT